MDFATLLENASQRLALAGGLDRGEARREARQLAARALDVEKSWFIGHDKDRPEPAQAAAVETLVARRAAGEPVAYILGEREFFGRPFRVTPDVLIPRPETELLVEAALARLPPRRPARLLDLGTGSGCIAITLALETPGTEVVAVDASPAALEVARDNAARLKAAVGFVLSDWFGSLETSAFEVIVGNPPYIAAADPHLSRGDPRHEPRTALASGSTGLDDLARIVAGAPARLAPGGWLLLEHGRDQASAVAEFMAQSGFRELQCLRDLAGLDRVTLGQHGT
ncbi:MAG TPA: peptide chain release factor N(5)-glutamine methyltransferase [Thiobacillaceae bacterium]|nr:peptide chain release factor N(5)-glutamine methyltransferase [Thiobacillaceae bacterium]